MVKVDVTSWYHGYVYDRKIMDSVSDSIRCHGENECKLYLSTWYTVGTGIGKVYKDLCVVTQ